MLTGQEAVVDLCKRRGAASILSSFGITESSAARFSDKSLAHAALRLKIPLRMILDELAVALGEPVREVKVSGVQAPLKASVRRGGLERVKRIIAVHSGKGGVGKTFVAVNLAAFLSSSAGAGLRVGLLDADVDCPNVLHLLGMTGAGTGGGKILANSEKMMIPLEKFGMKIISMAPLLKSDDEALLWRGPIVSRVLEQFLYDVAWGDLDVLILDLPPGTSDIPLTLYHMLPRTEVLLVTTPHALGLLDARKAATMAQKCKVKILGMVENMSGDIFGGIAVGILQKDSKKTAKSRMDLVGSIPLKAEYAKVGSKPHVVISPELKNIYQKLWKKIQK